VGPKNVVFKDSGLTSGTRAPIRSPPKVFF